MHVDWAIFAQKIDSNPDGTVNVYSMGTPGFAFRSVPATIPAVTFFVMLMFADADRGSSYPLQATLIGPDGKPMVSEDRRVSRDNENPGKVLPFTFQNIPVARTGTYRARFEAGGQRREWPFVVVIRAGDGSNPSSAHQEANTTPETQT